MAWLPAAITAGASLLGGVLDRGDARKDRSWAAQQAATDRDLQREFAQHGVRWRAADAQAAGIHPIYAMGANLPAATPARIGAPSRRGMGRAVAGAGAALAGGFRARSSRVAEARAGEAHASSIEESRTRALANRAAAARDFTEAARVASDGQRAAQFSNARQDLGETLITPAGAFRTGQTTSQQDVEDEYGGIAGEGYGLWRLGVDAWQALGRHGARHRARPLTPPRRRIPVLPPLGY